MNKNKGVYGLVDVRQCWMLDAGCWMEYSAVNILDGIEYQRSCVFLEQID